MAKKKAASKAKPAERPAFREGDEVWLRAEHWGTDADGDVVVLTTTTRGVRLAAYARPSDVIPAITLPIGPGDRVTASGEIIRVGEHTVEVRFDGDGGSILCLYADAIRRERKATP